MKKAVEIISGVMDVLSTIRDILDNPAMKMLLAFTGTVFFVVSMVTMFLPEQPSPTEKAIGAALATITKKMDAIHEA